MKQIQLTQGKVALVDDADYDFLNQWEWCAKLRHDRGTFYATCRVGKRHEYMHRLILGLVGNNTRQTDHIDGNGLNNRRANLRICNVAQNQWNQRLHRNNTTGYKGVNYVQRVSIKRWRAQIQFKGKKLYLGLYETAQGAARAYDVAAQKHYGEFALTNKALGLFI